MRKDKRLSGKARAWIESLEPRTLLSVTLTHYTDPGANDALSSTISNFVAEGRIGRIGSGTFEADIGASTAAPAQTANFAPGDDWVSGAAKSFTLTVDSGGNATFTLGGYTLTYASPSPGTDLFIRARAGAGQTMSVSNLSLNGVSLGDAAFGDGAADVLRVAAGDELSSGFTLTGDATMTWTSIRPTNSTVAFQIRSVTNVTLEQLTMLDNASGADGYSVSASSTAPAPGELMLYSDGSAQLTLVGNATPGTSAAQAKVRYAIVDTITSTLLAGGILDQGGTSISLGGLTTSAALDIKAWIDGNGNGALDTFEAASERKIQARVVIHKFKPIELYVELEQPTDPADPTVEKRTIMLILADGTFDLTTTLILPTAEGATFSVGDADPATGFRVVTFTYAGAAAGEQLISIGVTGDPFCTLPVTLKVF